MEAALEELEELDDDDEEVEEKEDEDIDKPIYNPLNLPLGFDGKPIPFWLYKLHGLGQEYKCEICGNYSYWGRRAFDPTSRSGATRMACAPSRSRTPCTSR